MTDEEKQACDLVERMLRELSASEVRLWRQLWYRGGDGAAVDTSVVLRTGDDPIEFAERGLAAAIELARAARSKPMTDRW